MDEFILLAAGLFLVGSFLNARLDTAASTASRASASGHARRFRG